MNNSRPLKVALVCHSDRLGGAAVVTYRLMQALRAEGVDARMVVFTRLSSPLDTEVSLLMPRWKRAWKFMAERALIFARNGFDRSNVFTVSTASHGMPLHRHPWIQEADVINLNWINQGVVSLKGLRKLNELGKPVVWTMHDMWCMTGICHHAHSCRRYEGECGCCPLIKNGASENDLSHRTWLRKRALYDASHMRFVAVSNWLAGCAARSSLLGNTPVEVIPNAFPVESFPTEPYPNFPAFEPMGNRRRIIMGAARLDDPIKGLDMAVEALNIIFDEHPDLAHSTGMIFFGDIRDRSIFDKLRFSYMYMGRVTDPRLLRQYYASSDVVISASQFETLPGTLIEGQAAGALPVTFGNGGQGDIVTHKVNGYIAAERTPRALADGIIWALNQQQDRQALHDGVAQRFSADVVARRYIDLYQSMLSARAGKGE